MKNNHTNKAGYKKSNLAKRNIDKFMRNKLAMFGLTLFLLIMFAVVFAPLLTAYDPACINLPNRLKSPTIKHIFGTDKIGRDVFSRILYGGRISIFIGITGALGSATIGIILGCISGYFGKKVDVVILYISEIFMTFPQFIIILVLAAFMGRGLSNLVIIFSFTGWMSIHRLVRGQFLSLREEAYIEACVVFGISKISIMFRHILPNTLGPIIVHITLSTAGYVLAEAGLSFIGFGVPPEVPTWGNIINVAKGLEVLGNYPWLWIPPGLAISLFVLSINFFGDGLRDVLDPQQ